MGFTFQHHLFSCSELSFCFPLMWLYLSTKNRTMQENQMTRVFIQLRSGLNFSPKFGSLGASFFSPPFLQLYIQPFHKYFRQLAYTRGTGVDVKTNVPVLDLFQCSPPSCSTLNSNALGDHQDKGKAQLILSLMRLHRHTNQHLSSASLI